MNSSPPWSRTRCTQPDRRTVLADILFAERAACVGAIDVHGRSDWRPGSERKCAGTAHGRPVPCQGDRPGTSELSRTFTRQGTTDEGFAHAQDRRQCSSRRLRLPRSRLRLWPPAVDVEILASPASVAAGDRRRMTRDGDAVLARGPSRAGKDRMRSGPPTTAPRLHPGRSKAWRGLASEHLDRESRGVHSPRRRRADARTSHRDASAKSADPGTTLVTRRRRPQADSK